MKVAIVNPYEVSTQPQDPPRTSWISPLATAIVFALIIGTNGLLHWLGPHGLALGFYISAVCWFALSQSKRSAFRPINNSRMTLVEFVVVLAFCAILHGLLLPGVSTQCRLRSRSAVAPQNSISNENESDQSQTDYATDDQSVTD